MPKLCTKRTTPNAKVYFYQNYKIAVNCLAVLRGKDAAHKAASPKTKAIERPKKPMHNVEKRSERQ